MVPAYHASLEGRAVDVANGLVNDRATTLDLSTHGRGAVNFGVGGDFVIAPYLSLLAGFGTDLSTARKGELAQDLMAYFPSRTNRVTTSVGLGSHGVGGDLLIGTELAYEWGERLAVNPYQLPARFDTVDSKAYSLLIVIAGSTSFKAIRRAVNDITNAVPATPLTPTPTPTPAPAKKPEPEITRP